MGLSISQIAKNLGRNKSSISREIRRNLENDKYIAFKAQENYFNNRKNSKMDKKLEDKNLRDYIANKFLNLSWSPEEIVERTRTELGYFPTSFMTIYRGIYEGLFDKYRNKYGLLKASVKLRHKGKKRNKKGSDDEKRGKFDIENTIEERPKEANNRSEIGHWEADTVIGKVGGVCFTTLTDRKTRFLICCKTKKKTAEEVNKSIINALRNEPCFSITSDRGKEFSRYKEVSKDLKVKFYFPLPHQPWQRGTNENTNGLLREYFPKGKDIANFTEDYIKDKIRELNLRPRKCLGWLTPYEAYYGVSLHLAC